ncbi:unnamed protein product [Brassica oleracea]
MQKAPREVHCQAAHKILRYHSGSIGAGLFFSSDLDWIVDPYIRLSVSSFFYLYW